MLDWSVNNVSDTTPAGRSGQDKTGVREPGQSVNPAEGRAVWWRHLPGAGTLIVYSFTTEPGTLFAAIFSEENSTSGCDQSSTLCVKMIKSVSDSFKEKEKTTC